MIQLAWPWVLLALVAPALVALARGGRRAAAPAGVYLPFFAAARAWTGSLATARWRALVGVLAWTALVLAAARPQLVGEPLAHHLRGRDVMLAIDVSGSMAERDMDAQGRALARIDVVKRLAADFIARRVDDRVGLIVFGSHAYVHAPLTFDRATVAALVAETGVGLAGLDTALGEAIGLAVKRLRERPAASRVLVVMSDGENRAGRIGPLEGARLAAAHRLRVHTIGIGVSGDAGPEIARSAGLLEAIAARTGGRYFPASDSASLRDAYLAIDGLEPVASDAELLRPVDELFRWPLALALVLGVALAFAPRREGGGG